MEHERSWTGGPSGERGGPAPLRQALAGLAEEAGRQVRDHPELRLGLFVLGAGLLGGLLVWLGMFLLWSGLRALFA